jgi:PEGA domain-containing protein
VAAGADSTAQVDRLLQRGIELRKAGQDRLALAEFERAFALSGTARALAQMALAEQALGLWREAHTHVQQALLKGDDPWIAEHRATLEVASREIASQLGSLEVSCNVDGAEVQLDGVVLGHTPLTQPVALVAGANVIVLAKPGYFVITREVHVDAGHLSRLNVVLTPNPGASAATPHTAATELSAPAAPNANAARPAADTGNSTREILFYSALGLTALGVTLGITGYVMREVNVGQYNDDARCSQRAGVRRSDECPEQAAAMRQGELLAISGFSGAAVFGLSAAYLWWTRPAPGKQASFACAPGVAALACRGQF